MMTSVMMTNKGLLAGPSGPTNYDLMTRTLHKDKFQLFNHSLMVSLWKLLCVVISVN